MNLTINLEQALLNENIKTVLTPNELLQIKQYDTIGQIEDNNVFYRLGLDKNIQAGRTIKAISDNNLKEIGKFDSKRVFHISQIEKICNKYMLKFLPIKYFCGEIDVDLPQKVLNFELIYGKSVSEANSYIIAPQSSFKLEERPKDPLLFYKINEEYYYLIHKWGNDLSIFNRFKAIWNKYPKSIVSSLVALIPICFGLNLFTFMLTIIYLICFGVYYITDSFEDAFKLKFIYDSPFKL